MCAVNPLPLQTLKEFKNGSLGIRLQAKKFYVVTDSMSNAEVVILWSYKGTHTTKQLGFIADFLHISLK
jgi:hypothetical protein